LFRFFDLAQIVGRPTDRNLFSIKPTIPAHRFPLRTVRVIVLNQKPLRENRIRFRRTQPPTTLQEGTVVDSFAFQIDWITLCAVIGLLVSLVAVFVYRN
jgi:hypothetical protein